MASESHEIRLKIDAAPAQAGAKNFTAAIASVKAAVRDLERDSTGAFTKLAKIKPDIDVTALKRATTETDKLASAAKTADAAAAAMTSKLRTTAIASANALRVSTDQAARLRERLLSVGDTAGLARLNAALVTLQSNLANASNGLDVREARAGYADLASELNRTAREAERLRSIANTNERAHEEAGRAAAAHAANLDSLRTKFNPLYAASQRYETALTEIAQAEKLGAISAKQASNAREEAARVLARGGAQMQAYGNTMRVAGHQSQNAAYQLQDVFVTAEMGMNPMRIAIQQGSQLSMVMNDMVRTGGGAKGAISGLMAGVTSMINPISLATIAGVAGVAMLTQWAMTAVNAGKESQTFEERLDTLSAAVSTYRDLADSAARSTSEFTARFGGLSTGAKAASAALADIARLDAIRAADAAVASLTERFGGLSRTDIVSTRGGLVKEITETFYQLRDELNLTDQQAATVIRSLEGLANADSMAEKVESANNLHESFVRIFGSVEQIPEALLAVTRESLNVALNVAEIEGAVTNTNAALIAQQRYYAQTRVESNATAAKAQEMLATLNAQVNMNRLIAAHGADSLQVTNARLAAERAVYAQTVNTMEAADSVKQELMSAWDAANGNASAIAGATDQTWGWAGAMSGVRAEINAIISGLASIGGGVLSNAAKGAELTALNTGSSVREAAVARMRYERESEWSAREMGAGDGIGGWIEGQLIEMDRFQFEEGIRLDDELTAARASARTTTGGGGAVDDQTAAMIRQIDAVAALNEELQKVATDPVKKWMDSVLNWIEAGQQIEMGAIGSLKSALSDMIKTGTFDIEALGESILGVVADIVSDKAVAELANVLGRGDTAGLGGVLGGLFSSQGDATGDGASVAQGGMQAGQSISTAMVQAGQQVSQSITAAMTQGGTTAANAQRTAGVQTGAQIRTATTTSGQTHATNVRTAITQAGQQHASMVGAASGGGMGGGILDGLGGWGGIASMALGAFSEGGYSTSPVGTASMPASAFNHAPHFAQGTANTSGIPAVLHPNEAVIPLSKGRKIPVDMGDTASGGNVTNYASTYNIQTPDADSFRKSARQIQAEGFSAAQRSAAQNR